ncbi:uncharacterized protein FOMMEDRAFT_23344 [Fomitiporia mediterranea MF3/22]|uniref:uncharacterized protein n=1 Tax=Fomitiporia mediterranea (strain MF3/22) TaxID=694068 RepID=UPI0004407EFF|nr:uncharacterized protein FOMMEDRAFT_23344 [Fomitiporia mediterranea MF3/22]EJC98985.1 hypothetical protein FOMMEDRAFT_23344 [Fomitiporia mediterranea MF3/22]
MPEDDDDLPSYEEMLVQALTVHNDPEGTAPKQLFQWMAATYPLQANFRPSASQALQKAYKRGRFEKSKDGKYRLNARWEGGNTSRRTTRRPQSYSKAVTNPSPSSHPPTNTSQYPPQHYTWTYGGGRTGTSQSQSQSPAPTTPSSAVLPPHPPPPSATLPPELESAPNGIVAQGDTDQESHRSCMEAAYSILQALNVTSAYNSSKVENETANASVVVRATSTDTNTGSSLAGKSVGPANIATVSGSVAEHSASPATGVASATSTARGLSQVLDATVPCTALDAFSSRAALQGSLALLAAQLAELADTSIDSTSEGVLSSLPFWPTPAEASANSASASGFNILEGLDLDVFNSNAWAGLRDVDVDAKQ